VLEYLSAQKTAGTLTYTLVPVQPDGRVQPKAVAAALTERTCLVTLMHSNNETGAIQPVAEAVAACRARLAPPPPDGGSPVAGLVSSPLSPLRLLSRLLFHCDAAQSCGKVSVDVAILGVDYLTVVGHKLGAPKGVAALFVRSGCPLFRMLHGGGQEGGLRAGTECVPLIVGLGEACRIAAAEAAATRAHMACLRDTLQRRLVDELGGEDGRGVRVHGPSDDAQRLPNTLSLALRRVCAAKLILAMGEEVACSAGSACHASDSGEHVALSPVLQAMGVPAEWAMGTLRLSVGRHTTLEEVQRAADVIVGLAPRFRSTMMNSLRNALWRLV
jgi:cysteine desulfurase